MQPARLAPIAGSLVALCAIGILGCALDTEDAPGFPELRGPYLGQSPPGPEPHVFAPGIISTGLYERDVTMTPDGREFYFGVVSGQHAVIMETRLRDGRWTEPEVAPFSRNPRFLNLEPHISPDGQRFYFLSTRPADGGPVPDSLVGRWVNQDIWVMDRVGDGWGEPYNLGPPVNTDAPEFFPSTTRDGTIYFTREDAETRESVIYRARRDGTGFADPERLPTTVNSTAQQYNAFIDPDERFLLLGVFGRDDSFGGTDYYAVFRSDDDTWSGPVNLGATINRPRGSEWSPYVSPDGRYFFFMSTRPAPPTSLPSEMSAAALDALHLQPENGNPDIYWVDAGFIETLRPPTP